MISNPNAIFYTCIATGTTILAEFNSKDSELAILALKCLEKTPSHHISFTHTVQNRSYTFLIDSTFVYFAIYDKNLEYPQALSYLESVRYAFDAIRIDPNTYQSPLSLHCFQGEFNPIFHQLLASSLDLERRSSPRRENLVGKRFEAMSLLSGGIVSPRSLTKKKKRVDNGDNMYEEKMDFSDRDLCLSVNSSIGGSYKSRRVWKRHVWVVLSMDLVLCLVLFGVWLRICKGFKCVGG